MGKALRDKRSCMYCGTGLCRHDETWALHSGHCDYCEDYLNRDGETGAVPNWRDRRGKSDDKERCAG